MSFTRKPDVCQPTGTAELPMLDVYMPMMKAAAIVAAGQLGLFEALADGPLHSDALAEKIQSSARGTRDLCDFLVTLGYLEIADEGFANTASSQRWFTHAGQVDYTPGLLWTQAAWPMMGGLADAVRQGRPQTILWDSMQANPLLGQLFSSYMAAFAADLGPDLLQHVPITPQHRRLLDLGGSHGLHAIRFCRHYPQLQALIVDLPSALTQTPATIEQAQLSARIRLQAGDLQTQDWQGEHDVVFYLSVAHNHNAEDNARIIERIGRSLSPGGLLVIHEYLAEMPPEALSAAFRLTLLLETGTQTHAFVDYEKWLLQAGFVDLKRIDLNPRQKGTLLVARRPN